MTTIEQLHQAVLQGDAKSARRVTEEALKEGVPAVRLVAEGMVPAMNEAGHRFECSTFFVPELLLAARAMKASLELVRPILAQSGAKSAGCVVVGTVRGDLHDIGKNLVASMLEGAGFDVVDLGTNVAPERFVDAVREKRAQVVALSALLTTTMPGMKATIDAFRTAGLRDQVRIFVGGAPVTQRFAEEIGADGYSETAPGAVALARQAVAGPV